MKGQVAMLRGVNLGKRTIVMSELREMAEEAGFGNVRTLLASGNLVLDAKLTGAKLEAKLGELCAEKFGFACDVFVRSHAQLEAVIAGNPFKAFAKKSPSFLIVNFMRARPTSAEVATMKASAANEEFRGGPGCLYIKYPDGQGQSRFRAPKGTGRNWNTVTKLAAMAAGE